MTTNMNSFIGLEGDTKRGGRGSRIIYISGIYFQGGCRGTVLKHIIKCSLTIQCKKLCKEFYKTTAVSVYKDNKCSLLVYLGKKASEAVQVSKSYCHANIPCN